MGFEFPISRDPPEGGTPPLLKPSRARDARPVCEGSDERMGFSEILRDARRGVDTVLVFFWKHQDP